VGDARQEFDPVDQGRSRTGSPSIGVRMSA
jgi:hypothetical protein